MLQVLFLSYLRSRISSECEVPGCNEVREKVEVAYNGNPSMSGCMEKRSRKSVGLCGRWGREMRP